MAALAPAICAVAVGAGATSAATVVRPTCDEISGYTLLESSRWRIVRTPSTLHGPAPLWACRRTPVPPRRLLRLESGASYYDDCTCSTPIAIAGDRLLLSRGSFSQHEYGAELNLVELRSGRRARFTPSVFDERGSSEGSAPWAGMTPAGGVFIGNDDPLGGGPRELASLDLIGEYGVATFPWATESHAPSVGSKGESPGVYVTRVDGPTVRVVIDGAAKPKTPYVGQGLWRPNGFRGVSPRGTHHRTLWAAQDPLRANTTITLDLTWTGDADRAPLTLRRRTPFDGAEVIADLVPGTGGTTRVLAVGGRRALVVGRFLDVPDERRARLIDFREGRMVDLSPAEVPSNPSLVAITTAGALAVAQWDHVDVWDPVRRSIPIVGARDLAASVGSNNVVLDTRSPAWSSVYLTDAAGAEQRISLAAGPQ